MSNYLPSYRQGDRIKFVKRDDLQALEMSYGATMRWVSEALMEKGFSNLWSHEDGCWWAIHPEEVVTYRAVRCPDCRGGFGTEGVAGGRCPSCGAKRFVLRQCTCMDGKVNPDCSKHGKSQI